LAEELNAFKNAAGEDVFNKTMSYVRNKPQVTSLLDTYKQEEEFARKDSDAIASTAISIMDEVDGLDNVGNTGGFFSKIFGSGDKGQDRLRSIATDPNMKFVTVPMAEIFQTFDDARSPILGVGVDIGMSSKDTLGLTNRPQQIAVQFFRDTFGPTNELDIVQTRDSIKNMARVIDNSGADALTATRAKRALLDLYKIRTKKRPSYREIKAAKNEVKKAFEALTKELTPKVSNTVQRISYEIRKVNPDATPEEVIEKTNEVLKRSYPEIYDQTFLIILGTLKD
jgi:hypothetical protein